MIKKPNVREWPTVAIVCSWYERPEYLEGTVQSLLAQDYPALSIYVINDGSNDPRVREWLDQITDSRLTVVHQENLGFVRTIQQAVEGINTDFIGIMGAGDLVHPEKVSRQVRYLLDHPEVGAVGCGHNLKSATSGADLGYRAPVTQLTFDKLKRRVPFTHGTVLYRTSVLMATGGYDTFFEYCQDWELYGRVLQISEVHALNEPYYTKLIFADGASFSPAKRIAQEFYARLARYRSSELLAYYRSEPGRIRAAIDHRRARHLPVTFRMIVGLAYRREFKVMYRWWRLGITQLCNVFRYMW